MRNSLPKMPRRIECAVVNLDSEKGLGTHWVAYFKNDRIIKYFDSFGNLKPPIELMKYFKHKPSGNTKFIYNYDRYQNYNDINCGHLCLEFLMTNVQ